MALSSERGTSGGDGGGGLPPAMTAPPGTFPEASGQPPPLPPAAPGRRPLLPLLALLLLLLLGVAALIALLLPRPAGPARLGGRAATWCRQLWDSARGAAAPAVTKRTRAAAAVPALRYPLERAQAVASQMVARTAGNMADWEGGTPAKPAIPTTPQATAAAAAPAVPSARGGPPPAATARTDAKSAVVWPDIVLTAVIGSGTNGAAHIDGEVIGMGEKSRAGVILRGVEGQRALLELDGERRYVPVDGSRQHSPKPNAAPKGRRR